jgi:hypothetical protein
MSAGGASALRLDLPPAAGDQLGRLEARLLDDAQDGQRRFQHLVGAPQQGVLGGGAAWRHDWPPGAAGRDGHGSTSCKPDAERYRMAAGRGKGSLS